MTTETAAFATLFTLLCIVMLTLPFGPTWSEWRRPTDAGPLPVPEDGSQEPMYLADRFRERMALLRPGGPEAGYQPIGEVDLLDTAPDALHRNLPMLAVEPVRTLGTVHNLRPLYATADVEMRGGGMFSEIMSEGRLDLGPRSRVAGWAHADKSVHLGEHSVAVQRVSSGGDVQLDRGCCFERVHAPVVRFGRGVNAVLPDAVQRVRADLAELPGAVKRTETLYRVDGDCALPEGCHFTGSLVVTGTLSIGAGTLVEGDVKARKGVLVGPGASITGSVICDNGIHVMRDAEIGGPLVSETHLLLAAGVRLGALDAPTTVNAGAIIAEEGVVAHGTVWARQAGVVWGVAG
ncbi:polymer-forming cytoskeletal protein [Ramlibacter sp.]|uniref:bactofilin family protein n=1 Tax=Ramlibacter sp. TaxID=1917967 RepID=UPI0017B9134B|nr:polymer-forming cytoskeletal protein [Ramlibacter sp.]MBA2676659.1 polymer-forming cytoskeletal protein [Ramlibacter sp.]